jgi:hypothetical protein
LGDPDDLPQETGCFNTIEYRLQGNGSVKWRVLSVNEAAQGEGKTSRAER